MCYNDGMKFYKNLFFRSVLLLTFILPLFPHASFAENPTLSQPETLQTQAQDHSDKALNWREKARNEQAMASDLRKQHASSLDAYDIRIEKLKDEKQKLLKDGKSTSDVDKKISATYSEKANFEKSVGITDREETAQTLNNYAAQEEKKALTKKLESMVHETGYFSITGKVRKESGTIEEGGNNFKRLSVGNEHNLTVIGQGTDDKNSIFNRAISLITAIVGTLAILFYVVAGVYFITAQQDSQVEKAKNIMINTSLGLIIVFTSYMIVQLVMSFLFR